VKEVKFTSEVAASRVTQASHGRYGLSPREGYVLRSAPIRGLGPAVAGRRHDEAAQGYNRTTWIAAVGDENLTNVVEGLLLRGFLARRRGAGPAYADLTGGPCGDQRAPDGGVPMTRTSVPQTHPPGTGWSDWDHRTDQGS
jgi:hypothetical protein